MIVDLRSDTVTRPTPAMRRAMAEAEVGDDVFGDDPTVNRLEAVAAELSGKEAALFVPSGTMANQLAIRGWTEPGDEVLMESGAHPFSYEAGGAAVISGVQIRLVPGVRGLLNPSDVWDAIRGPNVHHAPPRLLTVEDTSNRGGGTVHPVTLLDALAEGARARGLRAHLDGARAFNAVVASGIELKRRVRAYDSLCFCLSKGLGAPVGSLLCGPRPFIDKSRRMRKMLGGGMRQAGILAAAGLHALEHHVGRLAEDHRRAATLAEGLRGLGLACDPPETNMVYVQVPAPAGALVEALAARGVRAHAVSADCIRLVTHLDVDDEGVRAAIAGFGEVLS